MNARPFASIGSVYARNALRWRLLLGLLAWASAGAIQRVPAACAQASPSEYQSLVQKGLHEYDLGNFSEAKAFFQQAHQLSPNARTLRGLGMTSYELRHYVEAIDHFQKALASNERPLTAQMRAEVSQLLSQARSFVTRLKLTVTPAQAQLRLDTRELFRDSDGTVLLDPGTHELVAEAPAHETVARSVRCEGGETLSLALTLRSRQTEVIARQGESALPPAAAADAAMLTQRQRPTETEHRSVAPYILIGTSGAVAVAGGVLLAIALSNKHAVENPAQAAGGPRYVDYQGKADSVLPLSAAGIAGLSLGLVGVVAGVTWQLTSAGHERAPSARLAVLPNGLSVSGHF